MAKPTYTEVEMLFHDLALPFYRLERDMALPGKVRRNETDAEHCWSLAFIGCSIAAKTDPSLDLGLIAQLAIVHDVLEVFSGDVSTWDSAEKLSSKEENEAKARKIIAERFAHFPWISETIEMYERRDTKEAQFVFALDKLIALVIRRLDKGQAYIDKKLTKEAFQKGLTPSRVKAQSHAVIGEYFEELWDIFDSHPEYFFKLNP